MMDSRILADLDRWLTTPPEEDYDDEHFDYAHVVISDGAELVRRTFKRMANEDFLDIDERVDEWAQKWCDDNGYDILCVDVDTEYE